MKMSNRVYDVLKWAVTVFLPAFAVFYSGLSMIWGFPYGEAIVGTVAIVETFLGSLLQISSAKYKKENSEASAEPEVTETDNEEE